MAAHSYGTRVEAKLQEFYQLHRVHSDQSPALPSSPRCLDPGQPKCPQSRSRRYDIWRVAMGSRQHPRELPKQRLKLARSSLSLIYLGLHREKFEQPKRLKAKFWPQHFQRAKEGEPSGALRQARKALRKGGSQGETHQLGRGCRRRCHSSRQHGFWLHRGGARHPFLIWPNPRPA